MDRVLETIERLREASEATRRRVLYITVVAFIAVLGMGWVWSISAQLAPEVSAPVSTTPLPSVAELLGKSGNAALGSIRSSLRDLILGDEPPQELPRETTSSGGQRSGFTLPQSQ